MSKAAIIIPFALVAVAVAASSSSKAKASTSSGGGTGGGPPVGGGDLLPGTMTPKSRVRAVDASTATPSAFAQKYSGDANRWKEIAAANPAGTIYPSSPPIKVVEWQVQVPVPQGQAGPPSVKTVQGLTPWNLGQLVKLPDTWA